MKKISFVITLTTVALAGLCTGIFLTARLDLDKSATAFDLFKKEVPVPSTVPPSSGDSVSSVPAPLIPAAPISTPPVTGGYPSFVELAKKVGPAVVNISTTKNPPKQTQQMPHRRRSPFGGGQGDPFDDFFEHFFQGPGFQMPQQRPQKSLGSGFIINNEGYILTNNHVVEGADEVQVLVDDKKKYDAKIIGTDPKTDVAIIKIEAKGLPYVSLGDSDQLQVGEWVMAVGNPFGLDHTVTAGIVSAKGRVIGAGPYDDFIQTDASINPGNSGGPLFNTKGEVIGVNTAIVASGQGIGFAIPINMAKLLVPQLISSGKVTRAWLGVGIQDITPELAKSFNLSDENGALISSVFPGSPAEKAGIKTGDIIRQFNDKEIKQSHDLPATVALLPVGQEVELTLLREGKEMMLKAKLGEMEKGEKAAEESTKTSSEELGLSVRDLTPEEIVENQLPKVDHGVVIINVDPESEAAGVGVQRGDLLLSINNQKVNTSKDFSSAAKGLKKGDIVRLFIKRDDSTIYLAFKK